MEQVTAPDPVGVTPDAPIAEAARLMPDRRFGRLPVVHQDRLVGIITRGDLVKHPPTLPEGAR